MQSIDANQRKLPLWKRAFSRPLRDNESPARSLTGVVVREPVLILVPRLTQLPAELLIQIVSLLNPVYLYPLKLVGNHRLLDAVRSQYPVSLEEYLRQIHREILHTQHRGRHPNFILGFAAARGQLGLIEALFAHAEPGHGLRKSILGIRRAPIRPKAKDKRFSSSRCAHKFLESISYDSFDVSKDALHWAAEFGQDEAVKLLLQLGAQPRSPMTYRHDGSPIPQRCGSAIHLAAANGHESTVRLLLRQNVPPTDHGTDALVWAAGNGQHHVVKLLAKDCRPLFSKRPDLGLALRKAAPFCHTDTVRALLELNAPANVASTFDSSTPLHYAAAKGSQDLVCLLLKHKANVHARRSDGKTPLDLAMSNGRDSVAKMLLTYDSSHKFHASTLSLAASDGHEECVRLLLERRASRAGCKPTSQFYSEKTLFEYLLTTESRCYMMGDGIFPALHEAVYSSHLSIVSMLLQHGEDVNGGTPGFSISLTPLHFAALTFPSNNGSDTEVAKLLIESGARVYPSLGTYVAPLHLAAERGNTALIRLLHKYGADPNHGHDYRNRTPLMVAAANKRTEAIETLLALGADINARDAEGNTALHYAAVFQGRQVYDRLVRRGAAVGVRNNGRGTAANGLTDPDRLTPSGYSPLRADMAHTKRRNYMVPPVPYPFQRVVDPLQYLDRNDTLGWSGERNSYDGY